jgi:hypothetical protein
MGGLGEKVVRFKQQSTGTGAQRMYLSYQKNHLYRRKVKGTTAGVNALAQYTMINEDESNVMQ